MIIFCYTPLFTVNLKIPSIGCGRKMPYNTWYRFLEYHNLMSPLITDRQASTSPFHQWLVAMLSALIFFSLSSYPATLCASHLLPPSHCLQLTHFENPTAITILILDSPWVHFSHVGWIMLLWYPQHWSFSHLLISLLDTYTLRALDNIIYMAAAHLELNNF